jgi:hypothetical protein
MEDAINTDTMGYVPVAGQKEEVQYQPDRPEREVSIKLREPVPFKQAVQKEKDTENPA